MNAPMKPLPIGIVPETYSFSTEKGYKGIQKGYGKGSPRGSIALPKGSPSPKNALPKGSQGRKNAVFFSCLADRVLLGYALDGREGAEI
jgi:hypothetical protein